ncbi:DNA helicase RecQ [Bacillus sp. FJAT-45350]|uniref:DNA helicase RecQ n=1 Tax=Bacillus sp. FJAT-45350 TaxID=2011014 RepID=UPI000BB818A5|nr:DNA helicase RecQ [Bacillus sp. FJAT-45350]
MLLQAEKHLQHYFGYPSFREGQKDIIERALTNKDTLGIMPTGGGKSICYQIPAVMASGITIVITPLISLMKDQVDSLTEVGIPSTYLNSTLSTSEYKNRIEEIKLDEYRLVYVAPERLEDYAFMELLQSIPVSIIAIDEAHCVSEWGHDFRPSYRRIPQYIEQIRPKPTVMALTATATPQVQTDICSFFNITDENTIVTGFQRSNLSFKVEKGIDKLLYIDRYLEKNKHDSGIIYASTRKEVEKVYDRLQAKGYEVGKYHGGMSEKERSYNQDEFLKDNITVMVATNAFGMGIDKSNVRYVIHYSLPKNVEAFYQEAGRAGRDGEESECILLFSPQDVQVQKFLIEQSVYDDERKSNEYKKLQQMVDYCHTELCLLQYILNYFADVTGEPCGKCSNCLDTGEVLDMTKEAQMVMSCIIRMKQKFGKTMVAQVLAGSGNKKVKQFQFDQLSTYGILKQWNSKQITQFIDYLIAEQIVQPSDGAFPTLTVSEKGLSILKGEGTVFRREQVVIQNLTEDNEVFEALRQLRKEVASENHIPPYLVFSDKTLREMSQVIPLTEEELLYISGVGQNKLEKYGSSFLELLQEFQEKKSTTLNQPIHSAPKKTTSSSGQSHLETLELYEQGMSVEEIAKERGLSNTTIINHIIKCNNDGKEVDVKPLVKVEHIKLILDAIREVGAERLKPIKDALPEEVGYEEIRLVLGCQDTLLDEITTIEE